MPRYETRFTTGDRESQVVYRSYEGFEALVAVACDATITLIFCVIGFSIRLAWTLATSTIGFAIRLAGVPYRVLRAMLRHYIPRATKKPAWAGFEEV